MKAELDKDKQSLFNEAVYGRQYVDELESEARETKQGVEDGTIPVFSHVDDLLKTLEE